MKIQLTETVWMNDTSVCALQDLADLSGLTIPEVTDLVASGVIAPVDTRALTEAFPLQHVVTVRTARRLRDDFELDAHGVSLALTLLQRIAQLEAELKALRVKGDEK